MQNKRRWIIAALLFTISVIGLAAYLLLNKTPAQVENSNWSMQGEWIVFACTPRDVFVESSIYLVRPDGSELQRLTTGNIVAVSPDWSPDGEEIAFATTIGGGLYKLRRGRHELTPLTKANRSTFQYYPAWSPDGQWIAFVSDHLIDGTTLFRVKANGSDQKPVISVKMTGPLSWSPDGEWIAFRHTPTQNAANFGIRKVSFDGSDTQVLVDALYAEFPAWSPDGKHIAFVTHGNLVLQDDGGYEKQITDLPGVVGYPAWSPDGRWIAFSYGEGPYSQLYKIKTDGSELQQITDMECSAFGPDWMKMPEGE